MASNLAVLTTAAAIVSSFILFLSEYCTSTPDAAGDVTPNVSSDSYPIQLTKRVFFFSNDKEKWIEAGRQRDVGWLMACSDMQHGPSSVDRLVHHIQESPANVLLIDSISDNGLAIISQMPRLRGLVIHTSEVTDAGLKHLLKMPHLETVGFFFCRVTHEGVKKIQRQMPDTHFEIYSSSRRGFVFKRTGCLTPKFRETYFKKSSWR